MSAYAYLAGVLNGDGWCAKDAGLRVKDRDFVEAFVAAAAEAFGLTMRARFDGYWLARTKRIDLFAPLKGWEPSSDSERAAWLRGMFDSEGNAQLRLNGMTENAYGRRVAFYSTNRETLERAGGYLETLGIQSILNATRNSDSHKGSKVVYELSVRGSREHYQRFADLISSSLARKRMILEQIPASYRPDRTSHCRAGQLKGAATKRRRALEERLPAVLAGIRELIARGEKPTQRRCTAEIPGYSGLRRYHRDAELLTMAEME